MLISIDDIKAHLRIDGDDEDDLLEQYLSASIQDVELRTKRPLVSATDERAICSTEAELPAIIKQYLLLTIGDMYRNRENKQEKSYTTYFDHLLDAYIDYGA